MDGAILADVRALLLKAHTEHAAQLDAERRRGDALAAALAAAQGKCGECGAAAQRAERAEEALQFTRATLAEARVTISRLRAEVSLLVARRAAADDASATAPPPQPQPQPHAEDQLAAVDAVGVGRKAPCGADAPVVGGGGGAEGARASATASATAATLATPAAALSDPLDDIVARMTREERLMWQASMPDARGAAAAARG